MKVYFAYKNKTMKLFSILFCSIICSENLSLHIHLICSREKKREKERDYYSSVTLCEISVATLRAAIYSQARLSSLTANSRLRSKLRLEVPCA